MYTVQSCAIIIYVCMLQKPFGKRFFFCKSYSKKMLKKRESYISNATQGTFSFENAIGMGNI